MKLFVFKDATIPQKQFDSWQKEFGGFLAQHIWKPEFRVVERDFKFYPTEKDSDGDLRPLPLWLTELVKPALGYDHVFIFIPIERWRSGGDLYRELVGDPKAKGIWGTNYSYTYGDLHIHYCRWDTKNMANTFGTSWHEMAHSFDALIKVETGVDIRPLLGVDSYDQAVVHGKGEEYDYIRHKENAEILPILAPHLKQAYRNRLKKFLRKKVSLLEMIIELQRQIRLVSSRKSGKPR